MTEYGFVNGNFIKKTISTILSEYIETAKSLFPEANLLPTSPLYTILKMIAYREARLWELVETFALESHLGGASGSTLDRFGADFGIMRLKNVKATGSVYFTITPPITIPEDFSVENNSHLIYYTTSETVVSDIISIQRSMFSVDNTDSFPSNLICKESTVIDWISTNSTGENPIPSSAYNFDWENNRIIWTNETEKPLENSTYYVKISGLIDVSVEIIADEPGSSYNTPANSITTFTTPLDNLVAVTNPNEITNGQDRESDFNYKSRLIGYPNSKWSIDHLESVLYTVDGVTDTRIKWNSFVDTNNIFSLTNGKELKLSHPISQIFSPNVSSISKFTIMMKKVNKPGDITLELRSIPVFMNGELDYSTAVSSSDCLISQEIKSDNNIDPDNTMSFVETSFDISCNNN